MLDVQVEATWESCSLARPMFGATMPQVGESVETVKVVVGRDQSLSTLDRGLVV